MTLCNANHIFPKKNPYLVIAIPQISLVHTRAPVSDAPILNTCNVYSFTSPEWIVKVLKYAICKVTAICLFAINGRKKTVQIHWPGNSFLLTMQPNHDLLSCAR